MNKEILEKLSFGFEIEGMFQEGMDKILKHQGNFVSDGSVNGLSPFFVAQCIPLHNTCSNCRHTPNGQVETYCPEHHAVYRREGTVSTEYSSQIFQSLEEAQKALALFTGITHVWNRSCGLHFHIGMKNQNWKKLWGVASNQNYLEELEAEAMTWCLCQKERLTNRTSFYSRYQNPKELINATTGARREKYRFLNFHSQYHTLEFRFLSPCEHKVTNISKLLNHLTGYLGRSEKVHREVESETKPKFNPAIHIGKRISKFSPIHIVHTLMPGIERARERGEYGRPSHGYAYVIEPETTSRERMLMGQGTSLRGAREYIALQDAQEAAANTITTTARRIFNR